MFQSMLLCAGLGTRLRPLTFELPKPLVPIGDRPLLGHLTDYVAAAGGQVRVVNTHHRPEKIQEFLSVYDSRIRGSHEARLLGTAGGIAQAKGYFGAAPVVVWNGDILARPNLAELVEATRGSRVVLAIAPRPCGQGTCGLDTHGRIVRLRSESYGAEVSGGDYMGICALRREVLDELPEQGCLVGDYLMPWLKGGGKVQAVVDLNGFRDVGSLASYLNANLDWLAERVGRGASFVHPTASMGSGVELRECVVMRGARVAGSGLLERVVVWPEAEANAPLREAIVTRAAGIVPVVV